MNFKEIPAIAKMLGDIKSLSEIASKAMKDNNSRNCKTCKYGKKPQNDNKIKFIHNDIYCSIESEDCVQTISITIHKQWNPK